MFRRFKEKVHKASKHSKTAAVGTSCLVIATLLVMSMLSLNELGSQAKGYTQVENGNNQSSFWYGFTIPDEAIIWQNMTVQPKVKSQTNSNTVTYAINDANDTYYKTTFNVNYARDDQFSLNITENQLKSKYAANSKNYGQSSPWKDDLREVDKNLTWKDSSNTECKFSWTSSTATTYRYTYYKIVEQGKKADTNWGSKLLSEYNNNYDPGSGKKKDLNAFVTNKDTRGREFKELAENFLIKNGFRIYYSGTQIPMTQNGKPIAGVEMVSITARDLYYDVIRNGSSKRVDLDIMLYTTHNYEFNYGNSKPEVLQSPTVTKQNGTSFVASQASKISKDDQIILKSGYADGIAKPQYYLSNSKITNMSSISAWKNYSSPIDPDGKHYLYVRNNYANGMKNYQESAIVEYQITYMDSSAAFLQGNPSNGENIDVGEKITLSQNGGASGSSIFYVVDAAAVPKLTRISYDKRQSLQLDSRSAGKKYVKLDDTVYIEINGIWYQSSDSTLQLYEEPIVTDEELRVKNTIIIYAIVEDSGKELGNFQTIQYSYNSSEQTEAPQATVKTSASTPASVKMGSFIGLLCNTSGSQIFYTTNGSAPVIKLNEVGKPVAGAENTKEYQDTSPIVISEENANYGKSLLIMAQAVTYKEYNGKYYRINLDSTVAKFNYIVESQVPVESVQSIPKTDAETPVEVAVGSKIQLYSSTDNVVIYYTLDGSEPTFDENGPTSEATKVYSVSEGVTVEKMQNSSLFTITAVAYKKGLAVSDITRLVFAYPGAVSSPYANPLPGAVEENAQVTLQTATKDAIIYYEIGRGSEIPKDPTTASKVFDASSPIVISEKTTIKAIAVKNSMESSVVTLEYTVTDKLSTPKPSIETGTVVASGTVITLKGDSGATIYYTLDGSDPKDAANKKVQVGSQVIINGKSGDLILLRTYAAKQGFSSSEEGTYSYSVSAYSGGIYADRESGSTVKNGDLIYLHTDMTDAKIYYTIDGSAPTTDSHCGSSVAINGEPGEQVTVMAMAVAEGSEKSTSFATFTYTIMEKVAAPTSSVPDGAIFTKQSVVELQAESGKIYYTTDESEPTVSSNLYKKNIVITQDVTIKAIAVAKDLETSEVSTFHYGFAEQVAAPIASYASGELEMGTKVTFTTTTEGATIYYRTDGKDINLAKKNELEIYKEPITINQATNFRVIAVKDQMQDSNVLKVGYTVKEPVVIEQADEEETQKLENQSNRLQSRRSFSETQSGPSFQDVILKNASYGAVVAAEEGTLPEQVQLTVKSTNVTEAVNRRVKQVISDSYGVIASYDLILLANGEEIEPDGTIEIGLPIPVEYENAMIYIIHVQDDGNIELYETRRSGGVAYAKVDHLSVYSITAPVEYEEEKATIPRLPIMYTLAVGLTGVGTWLIYRAKKEKREDGM